MPVVSIDGAQLEFQAGESVLRVAERAGIEIPHYCWHKKLSVAGNCRMCLVEVDNAPKLTPACQVDCREGMVVHTTSPRVREAQRSVQEFMLVNHPIDCPICDQAGECKLQDYYMRFDLGRSRMVDRKTHKPRLQNLGRHVVYNAERCIMCTRCVRFMDEIAGQSELGIFNRGDHAEIGIFPGQPLTSPYSLNTVDVCPVGALTSELFRFRQRVWNLNRSPSICPGCARGCNVHVDTRAGQVYRLVPRDNDAVNQCWMCDDGRVTYRGANAARLRQARVRDEAGGEPQPTSAPHALERAAELLRPYAEGKRRDLAASISAHATCEEAYVFGRFARQVLQAEVVAVVAREDGEADAFLRVADKNPNRRGVCAVLRGLGIEPVDGAELLRRCEAGAIEALLTVGHEFSENEALAVAASRLSVSVHIAHADTPLAAASQVVLPGASWVEVDGTWINAGGRAQRLQPAFAPSGDARDHVQWLVFLAEALGRPIGRDSVQTVRAELEQQIALFGIGTLTQLGPAGRPVDGISDTSTAA